MAARLGSTVPRVYTPSLRPLEPRSEETERWTLGYQVCDFAEHVLRMPLLPWQQWFMVHGLELLDDGSFRFKTLVLLVARQNGKSTISLVLGLYALYVLRWGTVLGVAQGLDTAEEILDLASELVTATEEDDDGEEQPLRPWLADQVAKVVAINGKRALLLRGRRRWKVKAASRAAARGFSGDLILFDELREQRNWLAWGAVTKSTMARPHALILAMSNAGDVMSVVLKQLRRIAHLALGDPDGICELTPLEKYALAADDAAADEASADTVFLAEWSAAPGRAKGDRAGWCEANPSLGYLIDERTVLGAYQTDPEWVFRCLDVATPTLTRRGWVPMGDIAVGDQVKGVNGEWVNVDGKSPVHTARTCYRVTLNDGRSVVCDEGHLWTVSDRRRPGRVETLRTSELIDRGVTYYNPSMGYDVRNFTLPKVEPLDGPEVDLPVHPYLLGLWLGDGSKHAAMVFVEARDRAHIERRIVECGGTVTTSAKDSENCYRIGFQVGGYGRFTGALRALGVLKNKHIPDIYLTASREQRLQLLQGLMDSDGTIHKKTGRSTFTNTDMRLIRGARSLVRSLGWKTSELDGGEYGKRGHKLRFDVSFTTRPDDMLPATLPRKLANLRASRSRRDVRPATIARIETVPSVPVCCIKVDAPDSLFLAGDLIPTHNTEVLCQWPDGAIESPYPPGTWDACANEPVDGPSGPRLADEDTLAGPLVAAIDVTDDKSRAHVVIAGYRADGRPQIEHRASRVGTHWIEGYLSSPEVERRLTCVTGQERGAPVSAVLADLRASDDFTLPVVEWGGQDMLNSYTDFFALVTSGRLAHNAQPGLDAPASMAATRRLGGVDVIDRRGSPCDASPLIAAVGAVWLLDHQPVVEIRDPIPPPPKVGVVGGADGGSREVSLLTMSF
ncbi:LAGLIDADG family homing endonuclease [[Clostridium] aminophilum]|uniref:LAGLIDADG family homing endonuclease n=4 Tax=Bacteria TaxID=2 RepID=UPI003F9E803A